MQGIDSLSPELIEAVRKKLTEAGVATGDGSYVVEKDPGPDDKEDPEVQKSKKKKGEDIIINPEAKGLSPISNLY